MNWYKVWIIVPGTDGDAENGPCEPIWWNDMVRASSEEEAVNIADEKCRKEWERPNYFEPGVEAPSDREMGQECPVCTGAEMVTDAEYDAWKKEIDEAEALPF